MEQVLDLDAIYPEKKILKLGGKEIDLTIVPAGISMKVYNLTPLITKLEKGEIEEEDYEKILAIIIEVLKNADDSITDEWVRKQINLERFQNMVSFIFGAIFGTSKKNEQEDDYQEST